MPKPPKKVKKKIFFKKKLLRTLTSRRSLKMVEATAWTCKPQDSVMKASIPTSSIFPKLQPRCCKLCLTSQQHAVSALLERGIVAPPRPPFPRYLPYAYRMICPAKRLLNDTGVRVLPAHEEIGDEIQNTRASHSEDAYIIPGTPGGGRLRSMGQWSSPTLCKNPCYWTPTTVTGMAFLGIGTPLAQKQVQV